MTVLLLKHKDVVKPCFVHEAAEPEELAALFEALFPALKGSTIIGIRHSRQSHFNNLALVCATLEVFTGRVYHIVTNDEKFLSQGSQATDEEDLPLAVVRIGPAELQTINIFCSDVQTIQRFERATKLSTLSLATVWSVFATRISAGEGFITKQIYFDCVNDLLKLQQTESPKWREKVFLSRVFDTLFEAFDYDHSGM